MKTKLLSFFVLAWSFTSAQNACESAITVTEGTYTVDAVDGNPLLPSCFGNEVDHSEWYFYTAPEDYVVTISSTHEMSVGVDTRLNVYSGDCGALICEDYDDDGGSNTNSMLSIQVDQGNSIFIAWDDRFSAQGFVFTISEAIYTPPVPAAVSFTNVPVEDGGTNIGVMDMNGDFLDDIIQHSSTTGIHISYQQEDGTFDPVFIGNDPAYFSPSWSMAGGDFDGNGFNDMMYGNGSGVSFMLANDDGSDYIEQYSDEYVFSQRGNCVDINNDGLLDAYMCHDVAPSVYYINDGNGNLDYNQGGLGDYPSGGHYGSIWVDYDNDNDMDMFIAKCGGEYARHINQMHKNDDGVFSEVAESIGLDDPMQTWSSAWGDFDNDGDLDVMVGASSFADGNHKLMENDGTGMFTDVTAGSGVDLITTSSIENITHDFDNDGFLDIVGMGTWVLNNGAMSFSVMENVNASTSGSVGDLNNDGFLDIISGYNNHVSMNDGNDNGYIKFNTVGTVSNLNGIGATIRVYSEYLGIQTRQVRSGDGFKYMSSLNVHFGLGTETIIDSVVVNWPSGLSDTYYDVEPNITMDLIEGSAPTAVQDAELIDFLVYPNPTADFVYLDVPMAFQTMKYTLFDVAGKVVAQGVVSKNRINLTSLKTGAYVLNVDVDGKKAVRTIIKE